MKKSLSLPDPHFQVRQFLCESNYRAHLDHSALSLLNQQSPPSPSPDQITACESAVALWCDSPNPTTLHQIVSAKSAILSLPQTSVTALIGSNFIACLVEIACGPTPVPEVVNFLALLVGSQFEEAIASAKVIPQFCHALHRRGLGESSEYATAVHRLFAIVAMRATANGRLRKQFCSSASTIVTTILNFVDGYAFENLEAFRLSIETLCVIQKELRMHVATIQAFTDGAVAREYPPEQMVLILKLLAGNIVKAGPSRHYDSEYWTGHILRIWGWLGPELRGPVFSVIEAVTSTCPTAAVRLVSEGLLALLMESLQAGIGTAQCFQIFANIAGLGPAECEAICELGIAQWIEQCLDSGSMHEMLCAAFLISNIMWKGAFEEIAQMSVFVPFLIDLIQDADPPLVQVILDGLDEGLSSEAEAGATALHTVLCQAQVLSHIGQFASLSENAERTVRSLEGRIARFTDQVNEPTSNVD
jgi:hypothetical protein